MSKENKQIKVIAAEIREAIGKLEEKYKVRIYVPQFSIDGWTFSDGSSMRGFRD